MPKEIIVEFHHGKTTIEVSGVQGQSCKDLTASLEKALGTTVKDEIKPEYNEKPQKTHTTINQ